ncbi:MAG TPA: hypothetical protein VFA04_13365 [Bryobacteraceae bacterium]|nr:hypothetical protein [Bryobacteraceae bacterium]
MITAIYRGLVCLHPRGFRRRFGDEMVCIFEEAAESRGRLLADGVASLARQWVLRTGLWRAAVSILGALLVLCSAWSISLFTPHAMSHAQLDRPSPQFVVLAASACLVAISFTLILCVCWFRLSLRRRA